MIPAPSSRGQTSLLRVLLGLHDNSRHWPVDDERGRRSNALGATVAARLAPQPRGRLTLDNVKATRATSESLCHDERQYSTVSVRGQRKSKLPRHRVVLRGHASTEYLAQVLIRRGSVRIAAALSGPGPRPAIPISGVLIRKAAHGGDASPQLLTWLPGAAASVIGAVSQEVKSLCSRSG